MEKALVTYHEAADLLSVSHWTVRQMVRDGRLCVSGNGRGRRAWITGAAMKTPWPC